MRHTVALQLTRQSSSDLTVMINAREREDTFSIKHEVAAIATAGLRKSIGVHMRGTKCDKAYQTN